ncbi:MAG TPA: class I SAM-dependent methyltransferase [Candidatus Paceibacterota bacterium]|nr:class I SAM-dependent methyltransferase [Candidatus Paceibacterota bacterium]
MMKKSPRNCIICGGKGILDIWNGLDVLVCRWCGLAWRSSFNLTMDYYVNLNFGELDLSEAKASSRIRNSRDRLSLLKRFLPTSNICDVGCGDGSFLVALRDMGYKHCWGIEPSTFGRDLAFKRQLDVIKGDIFELRKLNTSRKIEAITLFHVIEHLSDPIEALKILGKTLSHGGILVIETPDLEASIQKVTDHCNPLVCDEHLFYWSKKSLHAIISRAGFKILLVAHRSFDWKNSSIKCSLARLGLFYSTSRKEVPYSFLSDELGGMKVIRTNFLRKCLRTFLAYFVHIVGRDDYLIVVAERL